MTAEKIKVLIVDDEPLAREGIRLLLEKDAQIEIVGECANGGEVLAQTARHKPELVFLDIQMPEVDGFAFLADLEVKNLPVIVFVTAFDQYAVRAFEAQALDYLLKPFSDKRFSQVLERAKQQIADKRAGRYNLELRKILRNLREKNDKSEKRYLDRVFIKLGNRYLTISLDEVWWIEAADYYSTLHQKEKSYLLRESLKELETALNPDDFLRIHRSIIVNIKRIREIQVAEPGNAFVVLENGKKLKISRRRYSAVQSLRNKSS
jgi:two-component system, LytTR family, response regulator